MKHFQCALLLLLAISLCAGAGEPPVATTQSDTLTLPLDGSGSISLQRLLDFASETLGFPILFDACDQEARALHFTSPVAIPRSGFQGYFERLLVKKGYLYIENGEGTEMIHWVVPMHSKSGFRPGNCAKFVPVGQLEEYSSRGIFIVTFIPLQHVSARDMISALSSLVGQGAMSVESVRPVGNVNSLIVAAPAFRVWEIARLVQSSDVESASKVIFPERTIQAHSAKIADIEKRLKALEEKE